MPSSNQEKIEKTSPKNVAVQQKAVETTSNAVERLKHPLEHRWSMWLYREAVSKGRARDTWSHDLVELTTFGTVEDFWCLYHHVKLPSELGEGQYSVFKHGMRPEWEHPANQHGGRWLLSLDRRSVHQVDRIWMDMLLLMIGENLGEGNSIVCGAVVNAKAKNNKSKIAIWVSNMHHERAIREIGMKLKTLDLPGKINFQPHSSGVIIFSL